MFFNISRYHIKRNPFRRFFLSTLLLLSLSLSFNGCQRPASREPVSAVGFYFDTVIQISIYDPQKQELLDSCMELAAHYENLFSATKEESDIWNINHSGGTPVTVSEDTLLLLQKALSYAELTDGLADPTIGSLSQLWNFGSDNQQLVPSDARIREALSHVDYRGVILQGNEVLLKDPDARMDLGFIAKGYIADRMKEYLCSQGVTSAQINLGGNIMVIGNKPGNLPFRIGIQKPFAPSGTALTTVELTNRGIVSSGSYERCFEKDGTLYHHILSPQTGYPIRSGLSQVSILSESCVDADALSTVCFLSGYEKAVSLLENFPDTQAVFVTEDGEILYYHF